MEKILNWLKLFEENWKAKNVNGIISLFDKNVVYYESPKLKLNSIDEIRKEWELIKEQDKISLELEVIDKNEDKYIIAWNLSFLNKEGKTENFKGTYEIVLDDNGICIEFKQYEK
jgi:ketosteroid isomerase-like protein